MYDNEQEELNYKLMLACKSGDLEHVKYLLTSSELDIHASINIDDDTKRDSPLAEACWCGHLDVVEYLLTSSDLEEKADISFRGYIALKFACYQGHLDVVKFLLTSPKLKTHAKLNGRSEQSPLLNACDGERFEVVKYLMESDELDEKPNLDSISEAIESLYSTKNWAYLEYFIFNDSVDLTEMFRGKLLYWEDDIVDNIKEMLERKELMNTLTDELNVNEPIKKKIKL